MEVHQVLQKLREHRLYMKAEKCLFHQTEISFLGYRICPEGVKMEVAGGKYSCRR